MPLSDIYYLTPQGWVVPTFEDVQQLEYDQYLAIYGADAYIGNNAPDSVDTQLVSANALGNFQNMQWNIRAYNNLSPSTADLRGLQNCFKINGLTPLVATFSQVDLVIVGVAFSEIENGVAKDVSGNLWNLPPSVTIPFSGTITVTATAQLAGALAAPPNTVNGIYFYNGSGWQTVNNPSNGSPGNDSETLEQMRIRQASSTALPSQGILSGILAGIASIPGVDYYRAYTNPTDTTDSNGLPPYTTGFVVDGGDATAIATIIATKKIPGTPLAGNLSPLITVNMPYGVTELINFYRPTVVPIWIKINLQPLANWLTTTQNFISASLNEYVAGLTIGDDVYLTKLYAAANLCNQDLSTTYNIAALETSTDGITYTPANVAINFTALATCPIANITYVITP